jgi:peptide deformylase
MAVLTIRTLPDPVLRQKSKRVGVIGNSTRKLVADMLETLHAVPGRAGLAAPQVGVPLRVAVISIPPEEDEEAKDVEDIVLINPEIVKCTGERLINEACLSIPGYHAEVKRSISVTVKGRDQTGKEVRIKATDLLAQALEHEIDHLNGVLYIDHLESMDELHKVEPEVPQPKDV